jgi:tRNA A-37 threonylcarbamoyl transferase component Bud32
MAELTVKSECKSQLRRAADTFLNVTFPVWAVLSPIGFCAAIVQLISAITMHQRNVYNFYGIAAACLTYSLGCILLKRALSNDMMIVDKQGVRLPHCLGTSINIFRNIPWKSISRVQATIVSDDVNSSKLTLVREKGRAVSLPLKHLQPDFVEQLLLATSMWAPDRCDASLQELQSKVRIGVRQSDNVSYTDLWEEELGRRFCPTAYVPLEAGKSLRNNSLKVINHLASGGLSALYLCQMDNKNLVVLKEAVIPQHGAENVKEKAKELFEREAHLLMKVDHPGIVRVLDTFFEGERNYLLLEYINGTDLRQLVKQYGPQKEPDVLEWAIQVANSLKYLHEREQPIIHRDLTPDNIVLRNDGKVILVDFGAANEFIGTATGTFVGKHSFIAPEQLRGKATVQSDIYAFGCTLYFLLVGEEPEALSESNPKDKVPSISDELAELVQSCTQMEASDRYQSVAQLIPVLRRMAAQSAVL